MGRAADFHPLTDPVIFRDKCMTNALKMWETCWTIIVRKDFGICVRSVLCGAVCLSLSSPVVLLPAPRAVRLCLHAAGPAACSPMVRFPVP